VAIGSSCMISVVFNPQGVGSRSATLAIAEQATASIPALSLPSIQLSGNGCRLSLSSRGSFKPRDTGVYATWIALPVMLLSVAGLAKSRRRKVLLLCALLFVGFCLLQISCGGNTHTPPVQICS
jgi:hypothetical protein